MTGHQLHNYLFSRYEGATSKTLTDAAAVANLQEFATMLAYWSKAMDSALAGDIDGTKSAIKLAFEHADRCERRTKVPDIEDVDEIVRYDDL